MIQLLVRMILLSVHLAPFYFFNAPHSCGLLISASQDGGSNRLHCGWNLGDPSFWGGSTPKLGLSLLTYKIGEEASLWTWDRVKEAV